jgi:amino acid transporter
MGGFIALLALSGSFVWLAVVSTLARMIVYSISIASLLRLERGKPLIWLMVATAITVCAWAAIQSAWPSWRMLLILVGVGTLLYALARFRDRKRPPEAAEAAIRSCRHRRSRSPRRILHGEWPL